MEIGLREAAQEFRHVAPAGDEQRRLLHLDGRERPCQQSNDCGDDQPASKTLRERRTRHGDVGACPDCGQVITNLIENARSFVPDEHGHITISLARAGKFNIITVDDNGPGIRAENIDRIFERFYTDRPHQGFGQNSGLGLSISKQIVEAHGGKIWAENRIGSKPGDDENDDDENPVLGARFIVRLPAI